MKIWCKGFKRVPLAAFKTTPTDWVRYQHKIVLNSSYGARMREPENPLTTLQKIDAALREFFGVAVDFRSWHGRRVADDVQ